jgi:hypothetical protein
MDKFLSKRNAMKEEAKEAAGIGHLERQVKKSSNIFDDSPTNSPPRRIDPLKREKMQSEDYKREQKLKQQYLSKLYTLLMDIETRFMKPEAKQLDQAESLLYFTRNQFIREFQRVMDKDESKTLKYQMLKVAGVFNKNLNRLNCEWSNFVDRDLMDILKKHYR